MGDGEGTGSGGGGGRKRAKRWQGHAYVCVFAFFFVFFFFLCSLHRTMEASDTFAEKATAVRVLTHTHTHHACAQPSHQDVAGQAHPRLLAGLSQCEMASAAWPPRDNLLTPK